jgi:hypothetical protein
MRKELEEMREQMRAKEKVLQERGDIMRDYEAKLAMLSQ